MEINQAIETLNAHYTWPCDYSFKFIVPKDRIDDLMTTFSNTFKTTSQKKSSKGTYISLTATAKVKSANEVLEIYKTAKKIDGLIAL